MADMIAVSAVEQRALELENLGVDFICVHTASDIQSTGKNPLNELARITDTVTKTKIAVAGGINLAMIGDVARFHPEIVIVGTGLTKQSDKKDSIAHQMKSILKGHIQPHEVQ